MMGRATLVLFSLLAGPLAGQERHVARLIDFGVEPAGDWYIVNDGVMGGRSSSGLQAGDGGVAVFAGYLSLENNGGFASARTLVPEGSLDGASRILLRVRGDGKRYQLRLRPGGRLDGIAFAAGFQTTAGEWITVALPLEAFQPTFRGRRPRGVGPLDPARIRQIGIMLSDKQEGPFRLEIDWMGVDGEHSASSDAVRP